MNIKELNQKYNFHDSCITSINYYKNYKKLEIILEFCNWMQIWFKQGEPELQNLKLVFYGISKYKGLNGNIDYFSISNAEIKNNEYILLIEDDFNNEFYQISLSPVKIEVEIMEIIND